MGLRDGKLGKLGVGWHPKQAECRKEFWTYSSSKFAVRVLLNYSTEATTPHLAECFMMPVQHDALSFRRPISWPTQMVAHVSNPPLLPAPAQHAASCSKRWGRG